MKLERWLYFGCGRDVGHHLFTSGAHPSQMWRSPDEYHLERRLQRFDGMLAPIPSTGGAVPLYRAAFSRLDALGACAISWWDCSVDKRPGSNSTIFAPGLDWEDSAMFVAARHTFPWVFARLPEPLRLAE